METGTYSEAQDSLQLMVSLLPQLLNAEITGMFYHARIIVVIVVLFWGSNPRTPVCWASILLSCSRIIYVLAGFMSN